MLIRLFARFPCPPFVSRSRRPLATLQDTLSHELIHLYDTCKFDVDFSNLRHHACTEVGSRSSAPFPRPRSTPTDASSLSLYN